MKKMNLVFSKSKIAYSFLILGMIFITNHAVALENDISDKYCNSDNIIQTDLNNEWKLLVNQKDVFIYYSETTETPCKSYTLKIVNNSKEKIAVSFGVAGKLNDECKGLYANYNSFQSRNIVLNPNETIIGSATTTALLIPNSNSIIPIEELIQNLIIQNIAK